MAKQKQIDLKGVKTISVVTRKSKVNRSELGKVYEPNAAFTAFAESLPHILVAADLRTFAKTVAGARRAGKPVIVMMGAHVVKVGLGPLIVDLMKQGIVTGVAMNSAAAIHDVEMAMWGKTSEDVETNLQDGTFGMSRETGEYINGLLNEAVFYSDAGYGEALGMALEMDKARNRDVSILATGYRLGLPVTVHAAIGTDIIHQQPTMDGSATGEMSFRDFKVLCNSLTKLRGGSVVMNIGSAVILPEVFLKALTVVRNLGHNARGFITANFDMLQHYRPRVNVVQRPTKGTGSGQGKGYMFTGHHEIMIPLTIALIKMELSRGKRAGKKKA